MKKLVFILFLAVFASCEKDEAIEPETLALAGTWKVLTHTIETYNSAGAKVSTENLTNDPDAIKQIVFTTKTAVITSNKGLVENSAIELSQSNGKTYLHFVNPAISDISQIEVSIVSGELIWYAEAGNPKTVLRIKFARQ